MYGAEAVLHLRCVCVDVHCGAQTELPSVLLMYLLSELLCGV
jgi:hypothetical protein